MASSKGYIPRGYRNNNPCNIRRTRGKAWVGEVQPSLDPAFKQFRTMAYGFRAALLLVRNYGRRYQCRTIRDIISRWAPPQENSTAEYIKAVCTEMGSGSTPQTVIDATDGQQMQSLVRAMAMVENGFMPRDEDVAEGWRLLTEEEG